MDNGSVMASWEGSHGSLSCREDNAIDALHGLGRMAKNEAIVCSTYKQTPDLTEFIEQLRELAWQIEWRV
jgi:hypothetical protein